MELSIEKQRQGKVLAGHTLSIELRPSNTNRFVSKSILPSIDTHAKLHQIPPRRRKLEDVPSKSRSSILIAINQSSSSNAQTIPTIPNSTQKIELEKKISYTDYMESEKGDNETAFSREGRRLAKLFPPIKAAKSMPNAPIIKNEDKFSVNVLPCSASYATLNKWDAEFTEKESVNAYFLVMQNIVMREGLLVKVNSLAKSLDDNYWKYAFLRMRCIQTRKPSNTERVVARRSRIRVIQEDLSIAVAHLRSASIAVLESISALRSFNIKSSAIEFLLSIFWHGENYVFKMVDDLRPLQQFSIVKFWMGFYPDTFFCPPMDHAPRAHWAESAQRKYFDWLEKHRKYLKSEHRKISKSVPQPHQNPPSNARGGILSENGSDNPTTVTTTGSLKMHGSASISNIVFVGDGLTENAPPLVDLGGDIAVPDTTRHSRHEEVAVPDRSSNNACEGNSSVNQGLSSRPELFISEVSPGVTVDSVECEEEKEVNRGKFDVSSPAVLDFNNVSDCDDVKQSVDSAVKRNENEIKVDLEPNSHGILSSLNLVEPTLSRSLNEVTPSHGANGSHRSPARRLVSTLMMDDEISTTISAANSPSLSELGENSSPQNHEGDKGVALEYSPEVEHKTAAASAAVVDGQREEFFDKLVSSAASADRSQKYSPTATSKVAESVASELVEERVLAGSSGGGDGVPTGDNEDEFREPKFDYLFETEAPPRDNPTAAVHNHHHHHKHHSQFGHNPVGDHTHAHSHLSHAHQGDGAGRDHHPNHGHHTSQDHHPNHGHHFSQGHHPNQNHHSSQDHHPNHGHHSSQDHHPNHGHLHSGGFHRVSSPPRPMTADLDESEEWMVLRNYCRKAWGEPSLGNSDNDFWLDMTHNPLVVEAAVGIEDVFPEILLVPPVPQPLRRRCLVLESVFDKEYSTYEDLYSRRETSNTLQLKVASTANLTVLSSIANGSKREVSAYEEHMLRSRQHTDAGSVDGSINNYLRSSSSISLSRYEAAAGNSSADQIFEMTAANANSIASVYASNESFFTAAQKMFEPLQINPARLREDAATKVIEDRKITEVDGIFRRLRQDVKNKKPVDITSIQYQSQCAVAMQKIIRGFSSRRRVEKLHRLRREMQSIVHVQRIVRGFLGKHRVKKIRRRFLIESLALRKIILRRRRAGETIVDFIHKMREKFDRRKKIEKEKDRKDKKNLKRALMADINHHFEVIMRDHSVIHGKESVRDYYKSHHLLVEPSHHNHHHHHSMGPHTPTRGMSPKQPSSPKDRLSPIQPSSPKQSLSPKSLRSPKQLSPPTSVSSNRPQSPKYSVDMDSGGMVALPHRVGSDPAAGEADEGEGEGEGAVFATEENDDEVSVSQASEASECDTAATESQDNSSDILHEHKRSDRFEDDSVSENSFSDILQREKMLEEEFERTLDTVTPKSRPPRVVKSSMETIRTSRLIPPRVLRTADNKDEPIRYFAAPKDRALLQEPADTKPEPLISSTYDAYISPLDRLRNKLKKERGEASRAVEKTPRREVIAALEKKNEEELGDTLRQLFLRSEMS